MHMYIDLHCGIASDVLHMVLNVQYLKSSTSYKKNIYLTGQKTFKQIVRKLLPFLELQ